ncbi:hypothetical protein CMUS01_10972 [Colletotrichum musicola]|uniref:Zn(2)-C6 fungal-type domain-containing protein n=1 Tax=Colletotrichum musicola TaxID=2175873 RepID=A0A8H6N760_9PEZI|nr:hypothetical protein CMUS01_10972 [Colletotrichum musicola]
MRSTRYSTSRQKACNQCVAAKAKCNRTPGSCRRCAQRGLSCVYAHIPSASQSDQDPDGADAGAGRVTEPAPVPPTTTGSGHAGDALALDFADLDLTCPINPDDIANRWLNSFVPLPGQTTKNYTPSVSAFMHRVLKSYANCSIRGHKVPPFIHWSQLTLSSSLPLSTCLSVVKICDNPFPGTEEVAAEMLQREMTKLYDRRSSLDDMGLLAAFQAHLIYAMVIFFRLGRGCHPFLREAMINSQELACAASRRGLVCEAEQCGARPRWEAWVAAEAKRRTLFAMCMFDSALLTHDGFPSHLATELRGLPAPASKALWEARDRHTWEARYNVHLSEFADGGLCIDELWPIPDDFGEPEVAKRRDRVDAWLEDLDEYGTMIYAVTSCTHGT